MHFVVVVIETCSDFNADKWKMIAQKKKRKAIIKNAS
jgi:hypothetical protein